MRRYLAILWLLTILMAVPTAGAQGSLTLVESDSYVEIGENVTRERVILGYVVSQTPENVLWDNFRVRNVLSIENVYDSGGGLYFSVENLENGWSLIRYTLRETLGAGDRSDVTVGFTKAVENTGVNQLYKINYRWSMAPTSYLIIAKLPKGSSLIGSSENTSEVYPKNGCLYLRYSGVTRSSFQTSIVFTPPPAEMLPPEETQPPAEGQVEGRQTLLYVVLAIVAVASPLTVWAIRRTRMVKPPMKAPKEVPKVVPRPDVEKILRMLHESEKKVVEALIQEDNLTQAELCGRTGIPKSTISRVLLGLEQKGVVRRVEHGMSKKVMLTKWIKPSKEVQPPEEGQQVKAPRAVPKVVPRPDVEKILRMLHESEKKVVEALIQEDNLTQAELCGRTGIPKATMSRILIGLEQKGMVRRVQYGMSKKVMLTAWAKGWKKES